MQLAASIKQNTSVQRMCQTAGRSGQRADASEPPTAAADLPAEAALPAKQPAAAAVAEGTAQRRWVPREYDAFSDGGPAENKDATAAGPAGVKTDATGTTVQSCA